MTPELQTLLRERADTANLIAPDMDAITTAGRDRVRRRRTSAVVALAVVSALLLGGGLALLPRSPNDPSPAGRSRAPQTFPTHCTACTDTVSWAEGSTIHQGNITIAVGHPIARYVRTRVGYVFTDFNSRVWSAVGDSVTQVGATAGPLVSDDDGTRAGWIDGSGKSVSFVLFDQATGSISSIVGSTRSVVMAPGEYIDASMIAIDGHTAYYRDGATAVAEFSGSRLHAEISVPPSGTVTVGAGRAVVADAQTGQMTVGPLENPTAVSLPPTQTGSPVLSPDGHRVAFGAQGGQGQARVYDTRSGRSIDLDGTAWSAFPYEWLGPDTVAVLSAPSETSHYQLLTCTVTTARCSVAVADLGEGPTTGGNGLGFALPIGDYYFPFDHS